MPRKTKVCWIITARDDEGRRVLLTIKNRARALKAVRSLKGLMKNVRAKRDICDV